DAPSGSPFMLESLSQMSSNSLAVSETFLSSAIVTTATPARVVDSSLSIFEFSASWRSTARVTRSSTFSALAPGHDTMATAARTGMSGSFRLGIVAYPKIPQRIVPTSSTQEMWRFSVKNRAVLCVLAIRSFSGRCDMAVLAGCGRSWWALCSTNDDGIGAVAKEGGTDGNDALVQGEAFGDGDGVADDLSEM